MSAASHRGWRTHLDRPRAAAPTLAHRAGMAPPLTTAVLATHGVGLCVQTQRADVRNNTVHDNCVGIFVDPGIGADVRNNRISSNDAPCPDSNAGVWLQGTNGTTVTGNRIIEHT